MTLDEIKASWDVDCLMDKNELVKASIEIPVLHNKYYKELIVERKGLKKLEDDHKVLEYNKWMYYQGKLDKEDLAKFNWQQCDIKYLKTDVAKVVDADPDIIHSRARIAHQYEKVEYLKAIIQTINNRSYSIGNAIEAMKFEVGLS